MGKRIKRVVAFLLVLCMLSAEIPFSTFAAAPSAEKNTTGTQSSGDKTITATSAASSLSTSAKGTGAKIVYDFQRFHKYPQPVKDLSFADTHGFWAFGETNIGSRAFRINSYGIECDSLASTYVALKLYVPAAGTYAVNQAYNKYANGGIADVYFMPGSITDIAVALQQSDAADYKIGNVDFYGETGVMGNKDLNSVEVAEAGNYYIVYKVNGSNPNAQGTKSVMRIGVLTLTAGSNLAAMELTVSVPKENLKVEEQMQITASSYMSDGSAGTTFQYRSLNDCASVDGNGLVTALASGQAQIEVTAVGAAGNKTTVINLQVAPLNKSGYKITYDFDKGFKYADKVNVIDYGKTHGFWEYYDVGENIDSNSLIINGNYGICTNAYVPVGGWVAVKLNVPVAGDYKMSQTYGTLRSGAKANVYAVKYTENVDVAGSLTDNNYVGYVDFTSDVYVNANKTASFGYVNFPEAGDYLLVYKNVNKGQGQFYIGEVSLDGGNKVAVMEMSATSAKKTMREEDVSQITASAYLSNGESTGATITYESLNKSATVSNTGLIKAVSFGEAEIRVTATYDGHSKSVVLQIPVGALSKSGTKLTVSFCRGFKYQDKVNVITYADTDGFWEFGSVSSNFDSENLDIHGSYGFRNTKYMPLGAWVAMKIQVPVKGDYKFTQVYGTLSQGSDVVEVFRVKCGRSGCGCRSCRYL